MGPCKRGLIGINTERYDLVVVLDVMSHLSPHNWWAFKELLKAPSPLQVMVMGFGS